MLWLSARNGSPQRQRLSSSATTLEQVCKRCEIMMKAQPCVGKMAPPLAAVCNAASGGLGVPQIFKELLNCLARLVGCRLSEPE